MSEEKIAHVRDDPLPDGVYDASEAAIIRYAQRSTRMLPIDDGLYGALAEHFTTEQLIEICLTVGYANMLNRFHATFLTDIDPGTHQELAESCPLRLPTPPSAAPTSDGAHEANDFP